MRSQFLLMPIALVATMSATAQAEPYMTVEQAQAEMFPGATFTPNFVTLDQDQFNAIIKDADVVPWSRNIKAWKVSTGEWFILDQVRGKDDWITYAVAIDQDGAVKKIEILECLEHYDGIKNPAWLGQFSGRRHGAKMLDIETITGATLSSSQITGGVKRLLTTYALVLSPPSG
jgi:hypothetical protein